MKKLIGLLAGVVVMLLAAYHALMFMMTTASGTRDPSRKPRSR
jgi:hypothetical protein